MKIKDIPLNERPREKALKFGFESLSDNELLAILIGSGVKNKSALEIANSLLISYKSLTGLVGSNVVLLQNEFGLSQISAIKLTASFELHRRLLTCKYNSSNVIKTSENLYQIYKYLENENQEIFIVLMLDKKGRILKEKVLYKSLNSSVHIDIKDVFYELVQIRAKYFALIHNHPSEISMPSEDDIKTTALIIKKAKILGIKLFDHIIIYKDGYYSFMNSLINKI